MNHLGPGSLYRFFTYARYLTQQMNPTDEAVGKDHMTKQARDTGKHRGLEKTRPHFAHLSFQKTIAIHLSLNITEVKA